MTQTTRQRKKTSSDLPTARPFLWLLLLIPLVGCGVIMVSGASKDRCFCAKTDGGRQQLSPTSPLSR